MVDRLRNIINRIAQNTGQDLLPIYDNSIKDPDSEDKGETQTNPVRDSFPNRAEKRVFDKQLRKPPRDKTKDRKRNRARDNKRLKALQRRIEKTHGRGTVPKLIPTHLYNQTWQSVIDVTGSLIYWALKDCTHDIAVTYIKRIALCPDKDGKNKYSFSGTSRGSFRARYVAATALLYLGLASRTGRKRDRYALCVKGIPQSSILAALNHPALGTSPSKSALIGKHKSDKNNEKTDGSVGYLRALKNGGFCYSRQARWKEGDKPKTRGWENIGQNEIVPGRTDTGYKVSLCRIWIVTDRYSDPLNAAVRAELQLAYLANQMPDPDEQAVLLPDFHPESDSVGISLPES